MARTGKVPRSGLYPLRGACNYICCISFLSIPLILSLMLTVHKVFCRLFGGSGVFLPIVWRDTVAAALAGMDLRLQAGGRACRFRLRMNLLLIIRAKYCFLRANGIY